MKLEKREFVEPKDLGSFVDKNMSVTKWTVRQNESDEPETFPVDEWKLTMTFIRRPRYKVGDTVELYHWEGPRVIDAISDSYGQYEYWIRMPDGSHTTYEASQFCD